MSKYYSELYEAILATKTLNTHSHHLGDESFVGFNLDKMLTSSYLGWGDETLKLEPTPESRANFLDKLKYTAFFRSLQNSLMKIYGFQEEISLNNWEEYSNIIAEKYRNPNWQLELLTQKCNYEKVILDTYWKPGLDHGHPDIFAPSFRIDPEFFGYDKTVLDHDCNNPFTHYGKEFFNLDDFMTFVYELIKERVEKGAVAIKSANAYDRNLNYKTVSKEEASKVFTKKNYTAEDVANFQDYFFDGACKIAAELDIPVQCHTGMGCHDNTRAANMLNIIRNNPKTKFALLHCSYPWSSDIFCYTFQFPNVYFDTVWVPTLSPYNARHIFHQLIETFKSDRVTWGCDTWSSEDSYAAKMMMADSLATVLDQKVEEGYLSLKDAYDIIEKYMYKNGKALFKI